MSKKMILGVGFAFAGIILLAGCGNTAAPNKTAEDPQNEPNQPNQVQEQTTRQEQQQAPNPLSALTPQEYEVVYGENGYQPENLTIRVGDTVVFNNKSTNKMWTASNVHPTHTEYPGTDIKNCFSGERAGMFDECEGAEEGQKWAFTFTQEGTWGYHNHLNSSHLGTIIVQPSIQLTE